MIPICLVTGFLGSGKTTLLEQIARRNSNRFLIFLVNELAAADVDGRLLEAAGAEVVSVPGGSLFCRCLVGEFLRQMRQIEERIREESTRSAGLVIEASGISNPMVIGQMLAEARLDRFYRLARIVAVIDPGSFCKLLATLPSIRTQVEAADLALLNKIDLFDEARLVATEASLRGINPDAQVLRTRRCVAEFDLFAQRPPRVHQGEVAPCADPRFATLELGSLHAIDLELLREVLAAWRDDIYRAKGVVRSAGRLQRVDFSAGELNIEPETGGGGGATSNELVLIVRGDVREQLEALLERCRRGSGRGNASTGD